MNSLRHILLAVAAGLSALPLAAQNSNAVSEPAKFKPRFSVGFDFTPEWCLSSKGSIDDTDPGHRFYPTFGLNFQAQLSRRDGVEFGVYYRSFEYKALDRNNVLIGGQNPLQKWHSNFVSLRLMYKFHSRIIDVSAGINTDFAVGNQDNLEREAENGSWNLYGFMFRVSKDIPLCKGLILQPEIHVNPCIGDDGSGLHKTTYRGTFLGCGVGLKYRF